MREFSEQEMVRRSKIEDIRKVCNPYPERYEVTHSLKEASILPDETKNVSYGNAKGYWGASHNRQISDFYEYIRSGRKMFVTAYDAFETHKAMCALLKSGREKKTVNI